MKNNRSGLDASACTQNVLIDRILALPTGNARTKGVTP